MRNQLTSIRIKNFRSLADVTVRTDALNVIFGPNGAGKSTFLDTLWFIRDCALRGIEPASADRSHGIGLLWDGANQGSNLSIKLETSLAEYEILIGFTSGRIETFVGEILYSKNRKTNLIDRRVGSEKADFYHTGMQQAATFTLREPDKLALAQYLVYDDESRAASELERLLRFMNFYHTREVDLYGLKKFGSEASFQTWLQGRAQNLWSVLRNLHDRRGRDERYDTIIGFMRESFPSFQDLLIEQTGPNAVYASFIEKGHVNPIQASGVSDGHLQMLVLLTSLFSVRPDHIALILLDEPEISLHPFALSVFAKAVEVATEGWNKQVFIATHSPVLISQFKPDDILAAEIDESGKTNLKRVSEMEGIKDLLQEYATGSLYMAEMIAAQSKPVFAGA